MPGAASVVVEVAGRVVVVVFHHGVVLQGSAAEERRNCPGNARPRRVVGGGERRGEGGRAADARLGRTPRPPRRDAPGAVLDADARRNAALPAQQSACRRR